MIMIIQKGGSRMNASSAKKSRGGNVQSNIKSNASDNSTDKDMYKKETGHREAMKYLKGKLLPLY